MERRSTCLKSKIAPRGYRGRKEEKYECTDACAVDNSCSGGIFSTKRFTRFYRFSLLEISGIPGDRDLSFGPDRRNHHFNRFSLASHQKGRKNGPHISQRRKCCLTHTARYNAPGTRFSSDSLRMFIVLCFSSLIPAKRMGNLPKR